jgi:hypothetical protein
VRVALEHLTAAVNLSSGLGHPSDKARAIDTFRALRKAGHSWNPDVVRAWALAHNWRNAGADDLRKYADGILSGRSFRTKGPMLEPHVVRLWAAEAAAEEDGETPSA